MTKSRDNQALCASKRHSSLLRISCRVPKQLKKEWTQAAHKMGVSFTALLIASLNEAAARYRQGKFNVVRLNRDEQKRFFNALTNPPEPNSALIQGFKDHNKVICP